MKKFFTVFFVVLGVLFLLQLIALAYFFIADPLNLKPLLFRDTAPAVPTAPASENGEEAVTDTSVAPVQSESEAPTTLSPAQSASLETVGVSPEALSFTPEQQACFEAKLGTARVAEIKAGAVPTFAEFTMARECI